MTRTKPDPLSVGNVTTCAPPESGLRRWARPVVRDEKHGAHGPYNGSDHIEIGWEDARKASEEQLPWVKTSTVTPVRAVGIPHPLFFTSVRRKTQGGIICHTQYPLKHVVFLAPNHP